MKLLTFKTSAYRLFSVLFVLILLSSCARNPVTGKKQFNIMSEKQEIALGQQSDPSIQAEFGVYDNQGMQDFINKKGKEMAAISHRPQLPFSFKILDSPVVNAFAVPGGYVYFTRGIMAHFNNEAEFAGVLGHEIGHVTARHSARQYSNQVLGQVLLVGGMIASKDFAEYGETAMQTMGMMFLKFGRDHESESDGLGAEYSTKIGYDAHEMADFFNTLHRLTTKDGQERLPTFQSTHPDPLDRYQKVHDHADEWQKKIPKANYAVNRDSYLKMIDGLVYGEDPRQGFTENNIFYHPEMKFSYKVPTDWQLNNTPSQVQMGQKDGLAAMFLTLGPGGSLQDALNAELTNNKLTLSDSRNIKVNGLNAIRAISESVSQNEQTGEQIKLMVLTYLVSYNGNTYVFNGLSYEKDFGTFRPVMENSMKSFKKLTDPSKINKQPEHIIIKKVPSSGTLQSALNKLKVSSTRHEELAILNGMELSDQLKKGELIKTIGHLSSK